jgi:hypothetical protein
MKTLITDYRNTPGEHCGSVAMKNLLHYYCGLDLPEEAVFGLGSAIDCIYMAGERMDPSVVLFGRNITMEVDLAEALGVDYREIIEMDNARAWEVVRDEVLEGNPTMLSGDVFYLDYRKFTVHFPSHRYVLVGFDDASQTAYVADRLDPEPQACSYEAVAKSRNAPEGLSMFNLWGKFHGREVGNSQERACLHALRKSADRMLGRDTSQPELLRAVAGDLELEVASGLEGLARFAQEVGSFHERKDRAFLATYMSQVIEKFGTGGGNFRKMFAAFLRWAAERVPDLVPEDLPALADQAAGQWTKLALKLQEVSGSPDRKDLWQRTSEGFRRTLDLEQELFETLDSATTP